MNSLKQALPHLRNVHMQSAFQQSIQSGLLKENTVKQSKLSVCEVNWFDYHIQGKKTKDSLPAYTLSPLEPIT